MDLLSDNGQILSVQEDIIDIANLKQMTFLVHMRLDLERNNVVCHKFCYDLK